MKFKTFMSGAVESTSPAPGAVRQAGYIPFRTDRMPTRKQVEAAMLAKPEPCPQMLGTAEVCDCRNHRNEPIHGLRSFGQGLARAGVIEPMRAATSPADSLAYLDERTHQEKLEYAARLLEEQIAREDAAYLPQPDPQAAADAIDALRAEMRRQQEERIEDVQARLAALGG